MKQGRERKARGRWGTVLNRMARKGTAKVMAFEQRPEESKRLTQEMLEKETPGR